MPDVTGNDDAVPDTLVYRLCIDQVKLLDSGRWTCELSNATGKSSASCDIKVIDTCEAERDIAPCFEEKLTNVVASDDDNAVFRCKSLGTPTPDLTWYKDGVQLEADRRHVVSSSECGEQRLEIRGVSTADVGVYKCKLDNTCGWAACDAKLFVLDAGDVDFPYYYEQKESLAVAIKAQRTECLPSEADSLISRFGDTETIKKFLIKWKLDDDTLGFPLHLKNKCTVQGTSAKLSCFAKGIPPLKIRWFKNNREIFEGTKYFLKKRQGILSLEIPIVNEDDTGYYMCEVRTTQGKIHTSCYLQVEPILEISREELTKPYFTTPMKRQTVNAGELIHFRVTAKGTPAPGFKWFKDGLAIQHSERISTEVKRHGVAALVIENAQLTDIGLYKCEVHNQAGRCSSMVKLSVRDNYEAMQFKAKQRAERQLSSGSNGADGPGGVNGDGGEAKYTPREEGEVFAKTPEFHSRLPDTVTITHRGRFMMECCVNSFPAPQVQWYKDDQLLSENGRYNFLQLGDWHGLEIVETRPDDAGVYSVRIATSAGQVSSSCTVDMDLPVEKDQHLSTDVEAADAVLPSIASTVAEQSDLPRQKFLLAGVTPGFHLFEVLDALRAPHIVVPLPDRVTPIENDTDIRLECKVSGNPCPKIMWQKDGELLNSDENIQLSWDTESRIATITLKQVRLSDSGTYSCVAYCDFGGHAKTTTDVQIRGLDSVDKLTATDVPDEPVTRTSIPEFTKRLTDKEATPGGDVTLECKTMGEPMPEVKWYKNDEPIQAAIDKYNITSSVEGVHTLVIAGVHLSDNQCYKCEAANEYGCVSTHAHVIVHENTGINTDNDTRPAFVEPLHSISVTAGEDAVLSCSAKGTPAPAFSWEKGETAISDSDRIHVSVSDGTATLTIKTVNNADAGQYYCIATNRVGKVKSSTTLKVLGTATKSKATEETPVGGKGDEKEADIDRAVVSADSENATSGNTDKGHDTVTASEHGDIEHLTEESERASKISLEDYSKLIADSSVPECVSQNQLLSDIKKYYRNIPKFLVLPRSKWVQLNTPLEICVEVKRFPDLTIAWYKDDTVVNDERCSITCEVPDIKKQSIDEPITSDSLPADTPPAQDAGASEIPDPDAAIDTTNEINKDTSVTDTSESRDTNEQTTEDTSETETTLEQSVEDKTEMEATQEQPTENIPAADDSADKNEQVTEDTAKSDSPDAKPSTE